jgi:hypothetical protein
VEALNTKKLNRGLINSLENGRIPEAEARAIYNTAHYNHATLLRISISSSVITLILALLLLAPPEPLSGFPAPLLRALVSYRIWLILICIVFAAMTIRNLAKFRANKSYIAAVTQGYPQIGGSGEQPAQEQENRGQTNAPQGDWGRIEAKKRVTFENILARTAKSEKSTLIIVACSALLFLGLADVCFWGAESLALAAVFFVPAVAIIVWGTIIFQRSRSPEYLLRNLNAFCDRTSIPLWEVEADLAVSADFGHIFFGDKYIVFNANGLNILVPGDIKAAEMHVWRSNSIGTVYYLRLYTYDGKKPIDISTDWLAVRKQLDYMREKYPSLNVSAPVI